MSDEPESPGIARRRRKRESSQFATNQIADMAKDPALDGRETGTLDTLTAMQPESDDVLREALECCEDGAIEQGDLSAIGLSLQQFHQAVIDRRMMTSATASDLLRMRAV
jgi:hypothetical protein